MPFMSPSACLTAWPSAMPTSSVVWWWSMCRSPLAFTLMSMRAWRASRSSMWSKKPMPVAISDAPVPSRFTATSTSVSLVFRFTAALRMGILVNSRRFYQGLVRRATAALALGGGPRLVWVNSFGRDHDPIGQRARRLVQRRIHAGARGAHSVPRFELGLWRRLLRHDAHLRPPALQGEG